MEGGPKRSLLHLRCWRRLVLACSDAAQLANQETQRARAVLAVRADVRWAIAPRARGGGSGARCSQPWVRGLLRAVRGDGAAAAERDAPAWRVQAGVLLFDGGAEDGEEDEDEDEDAEEERDGDEDDGCGDGGWSDESR